MLIMRHRSKDPNNILKLISILILIFIFKTNIKLDNILIIVPLDLG